MPVLLLAMIMMMMPGGEDQDYVGCRDEASVMEVIETFRFDYEYESEYECDYSNLVSVA